MPKDQLRWKKKQLLDGKTYVLFNWSDPGCSNSEYYNFTHLPTLQGLNTYISLSGEIFIDSNVSGAIHLAAGNFPLKKQKK